MPMITETYKVPTSDLESTKEWYFSQYNPWAYQASVQSEKKVSETESEITFSRSDRC